MGKIETNVCDKCGKLISEASEVYELNINEGLEEACECVTTEAQLCEDCKKKAEQLIRAWLSGKFPTIQEIS